jgi:hypothetical protein
MNRKEGQLEKGEDMLETGKCTGLLIIHLRVREEKGPQLVQSHQFRAADRGVLHKGSRNSENLHSIGRDDAKSGD